MYRTAKVSPVVNQGIGDAALRKNERLNSRGNGETYAFFLAPRCSASSLVRRPVAGAEFWLSDMQAEGERDRDPGRTVNACHLLR
jgi:hypothetical protein